VQQGQQSARRSILINTLWGKANVLVRYLTSFVATAVIAANYKPDQFGFYQLILTYLTIIDSINFLNPTHLRNHLVKNPDDENAVAGIWFYQAIAFWAISTLVVIVCAIVMEDHLFWWLLALGNLRLVFKCYEYMQVIADYRLRNDLTQKMQMMQLGSFNAFRIVAALLKVDMTVLVGCAIPQGIFTAIYQNLLKKKVGFNFVRQFSWEKYKQLLKDGAWVSVVLFVTTVQTRIFSAMIAEKMTPEMYGNFQLIVKLVEPATAIGAIVFGANYTVLAHTLHANKEAFKKRFSKISALSFAIAMFCSVVIFIFPQSILVRVFGLAYEDGLSLLGWGTGIILANAILNISIQYDMLLVRYRSVVLKYGAIFVTYVALLSYSAQFSVKEAISMQIYVPLVVIFILDPLLWCVRNVKSGSK
jgi:hypothetical protein